MTGTPAVCAFCSTVAPTPFRSTSSITPQPLVSWACAMDVYLVVLFCAFWMFALNPASVSALFSAGRSPLSQRGDDSVSGRMTHAVFLAAVVAPPEEPEPEPLPFEEQPARARVDMAATATMPMI